MSKPLRYSMEVDNGVCIIYSEYEFSARGLKKAKQIAKGLDARSYVNVKVYCPQDKVAFMLGKNLPFFTSSKSKSSKKSSDEALFSVASYAT